MLHLTNALLVCPLLLLFTPLVAFHQWDVSEALGKRVKHLYIKESPLPPIPPKTSSLDVNPGVVGGDCTAQRHLFSRQCLKGWFHSDAMTYLCHEASCEVPQLIVPDYGEATSWTAQGMLHTEWLSAYSGFEVTCPDCDLQSALDHAARDK